MDLELKGRRALVLASSRGLGLAIAEGLLREGAQVMICGRDSARLQQARQRLDEIRSGGTTTCTADLSGPQGVQAVVTAAEEAMGGVDILVANCGGPPMGAALEVTEDLWRTHFESMFLVPVTAARRTVPAMVDRGWGRVIAITASTVAQPWRDMALSNSLRACLTNWCKTLASEVAASGVTVNTLVPGRVGTDRIAELNDAMAARRGVAPEAIQAEAVAGIPAGRDGTVEEFAAAAVFLASRQAAYITGGALRVDGGMIRSTMT